MGQDFRRDQGGGIDRNSPVSFRFNGKTYRGFAGDTLASALLANGVHMLGRSFKYHRPRGILGAGSEDPAGIVQIGRGAHAIPNTRATEQEIYEGLESFAQNCWPSLRYDFNAMNDLFSAFIPAGFYNKTFKGPPGNWALFEPFIRRAAGLGKAPREADPERYEHTHRHCDVLVVGAGPAGLMAALGAARSGARVMLVEETAQLGGAVLSRDPENLKLDGKAPPDWVRDMEAELRGHEEVRILTRACAFGYYVDNYIGVIENVTDHLPPEKREDGQVRQRLWHVRARQVVLATGAIERPLVFHGNDRPGIMLAGACRTYLHRYGVMPGRRAAVFCNNDSAWQSAFDLAAAGAGIAAIIDIRAEPDPELVKSAQARGIDVHLRSVVTGTSGRRRIRAALVQGLDGSGQVTGGAYAVFCDLLMVSGGWSPNVALFSQSRGALRYDEELAGFRPGKSWQKERSAGACNGAFSLAACLDEGAAAGMQAAQDCGFEAVSAEIPALEMKAEQSFGQLAIREVPSPRPPHKRRAFVDLQADVTVKDLSLAQLEGYTSVEHTKRYTTSGMGTDQGKTANMNAFAILADKQGKTIPELGITTFRQPYKPVSIGAFAGQHVGAFLTPRRTTPMHEWHEASGALFEPVGDWLRPWVYPQEGESFEETLMRECKAARSSLGVLDASTLGKIDVRGKDARVFLNRVYTNAWMKLKPGHCRYGLMLGEDGMVKDDGVTACISDEHFHMTTTTGGAAPVMNMLEDYLQTEWPELEVYLTSTTEQWAVISLCGPNSAELVRELLDDLDPDPESFPFMTWREAHIEGLPVRVFRISFTGELSYEINIAASYGLWLWERVMELGAKYGITPYGTEAMHLLRAEKGYIITGQDTDGTMTPADLRMNWIVKKTGDFIGRRSLSISDLVREDRKQLVGLLTQDPGLVLEEGAHVIADREEGMRPVPMLGHVTSSYFSPNLKRSIAMAVVKGGAKRMGEQLFVTRPGMMPVAVRVTGTDFLALDEENRA
jgi:sarcosine oxidase subunit alpha